MTTARFIRDFAELRIDDRPEVGGKCASLGELIHAGVDVPDGFAIVVEAYERFRDDAAIRDELRAIVEGADPENSTALGEAQARATAVIESTPLPGDVEDEIRSGYARLCVAVAQRRGVGGGVDIPVAVRSSAVAEDGDQASFAGQQETYLWVVGADSVVEHVRLCWASLYTPQAIAYRTKLPPQDAVRATRISVGVQVMVLPEVSGVMFTASPKSGDRSRMAINASWGLGHAVVSGEVTPDEYWLSKIGPALVSTTVADKHVEYLPDVSGSGVAAIPVAEGRRNVPCLEEATILRLAELGLAVEAHYGVPQDIEWALERAADGSEHIVVLQSRPVTSWVARQEKAKPSSGLASMMGMIRGAAQGSGS